MMPLPRAIALGCCLTLLLKTGAGGESPAVPAQPGAAGEGAASEKGGAGGKAGAAKPMMRRLPGMQRGGSVLLPNQWSLRPAGKQIKMGDFPVNIALHPSGLYAAILHSGYGEHEILSVDLKRDAVVSRVPLDDTFYGLGFSPDGKRLFASGGVSETVIEYAFEGGHLSKPRVLSLGDPKQETLVPCGLACASDGKTLYVCNAWHNSLCLIPLDDPGRFERFPLPGKERYPYTVIEDRAGSRLFVSQWGGGAVSVFDLKKRAFVAEWPTPVANVPAGESHPTEMALSPDGKRLFVACANSNAVVILDTANGRPQEAISSALHPKAPVGSTPNSVALSADGKALAIANADNNNVAMFNVSKPGRAESLGFIPAGWYPTSVRFAADGKRIFIANGKGAMSKSNVQGPRPYADPPPTVRQYIAELYDGTLSMVAAPSPAEMAAYSKTAYECSPLRADLAPASAPRESNNPVPAKVGDPSPIRYCLYIIKENRTYDQVFGDMKEGNGAADLCLFPERVTPNHHALAREFVLLDNFYVESEVSADGHEWSTAAYATDFTEKTWPLNYRDRGTNKVGYPSEGSNRISSSSGGYIWDRCREAGVSYRSYGEFVDNALKVGDPGKALVKGLEGHFDPLFRSYDLDYPDAKRTDRFLEELAGFEAKGDLPRFIVLRLPNDHTHGTARGKPTPTAMVAENDLALGRLVEGFSKSKFWKESVILVVEDDAQNGSDHVDAHRTVALAIGPYIRRGSVDSTLYSTASMLRTMELILGLQPMSQFDAAATPMYNSFTGQPDFRPYKHRPANVALDAVNKPGSWGEEESAKLDFSREDAADDLLLNEIVWKSVRGAESVMPPPVRASFVRVLPEEDDDEEEGEKKVEGEKEGDEDDG